jgi:hypothetical protein
MKKIKILLATALVSLVFALWYVYNNYVPDLSNIKIEDD